MEQNDFVIERTYTAPLSLVWKAISNRDEMEKWYFKLAEFKPEVGFEFKFTGGPSPDKQYTHVCCVTQVIANKRLAYTWRYEGYEGISEVIFELFEEGQNTRLRLTHTGLDSFPGNPDFARANFVEGWNMIIGKLLKDHLEK